MLTFNSPLYLFLLIILPLIIYCSHFLKDRGGKIKFPISLYGNVGSLKFRDYGLNVLYFTTYSFFFFYLAIIGMILTLAGPSISKRRCLILAMGRILLLY